jgi:hypothetical protein
VPTTPRKTTSKKPAKQMFSPKKPKIDIPEGERCFILDVPYLERNLVSSLGGRWNSDVRATIFVGKHLPENLQPYGSKPFSWERWLEDDLNNNIGDIPAAAHTLQPRPHQQQAAQSILRASKAGARGFLLADDVGLGKTSSALEGIRLLKKTRKIQNVLIISPLAVVPHWRRTVADTGLAQEGIRFCVINYDRLKKLLDVPESAKTAKRTKTKNRRIAKDGVSLVNWDLIIVDESHNCKNMEAQRSKAVSKLGRYNERRENAPFILWLSATAGQNPLELSYLSPLLAQLSQSKLSEFKDFGAWLDEQGFHVVHEKRFNSWSWSEDGREQEQDVAKMRDFLFNRKTPVALRRLPTDISGWPEILRSLQPVELSPEQWRLYEQAWTMFRKEMKLALKGKDPKAGMVARLRFRQKSSLIRVNGTVDQVLDLLENGHQVTVSFQFIESLDAVKEQLLKHKISVSVMDGRDRDGREEQRLLFQKGINKVCLFTPTEGFSLHQNELLADGSHASNVPRSLIIHDPRYSGIQSIQIEGRQHRDGQFAQAYYMFGADTVEEDIVKTLLGRIISTKALVGDDTETIRLLEKQLVTSAL